MPCGIHGGARDSLAVNVATNAWHCHACGARGGDSLAYHRCVTGAGFRDAARELGAWADDDGDDRCAAAPAPRPAARPPAAPPRERLSMWGRELWNDCRPVSGPAHAYLAARTCVVPPADGHLRWHPALQHPSGYVGPALVALVTEALTRRPLSLHRTWTGDDGTKADLGSPRMLLGGHRKRGGVIRLWPDEAVTTGLAIGEGIETALSLAHAFAPVWSCIDAGNLAEFPVLEGIESLVIGADHDPRGIEAAETCAARWSNAGRSVRIVLPSVPRSDLNDLARTA